jgi:hypothetical protein
LRVFGGFGGAALATRLITREFRRGTVLYLDTLPLSRARIITAKALLGGAVLGSITLLWLAGLAVASDVALASRLTGAVLLKAGAWLFFCWCTAVLYALLGRYRFPLVIFAVFAASMVEDRTELELGRQGPLALVDERLPFDLALHGGELGFALVGGLALFLFALLLSTARDGAITQTLALRMSRREKVFFATAALGSILAAVVLEDKDDKPPYEFPANVRVSEGPIEVALRRGRDASLDPMAGSVAQTLARSATRLGLSTTPPVFLSTRRDLDPDRYQIGWSNDGEGLLARFGPGEGFDEARFTDWLLRELVAEAGEDRPRMERQAWLLDGLARWLRWEGEGRPALDEVWRARARHGLSRMSLDDAVDGWFTFRETVGSDIGAAVAAAGLVALSRACDDDGVTRVLRATVAREVHGDGRDTWHDLRNPPLVVVERECGLSRAGLLAGWRDEVGDASTSTGGAMPTASLRRDGGALSWRLDEPPAGTAPERVQLRYRRLGAFDKPLPLERLDLEEVPLEQALEGLRFPSGFTPGTRVAWEVRWQDAATAGWLTTGIRREEVP